MAVADREPIEITDDTRLSQYGESNPGEGFRDRLRTDSGETEVSLIFGEVDATAASLLVTRTVAPWRMVRSTTAGKLRASGFIVVHSPTRANRLHVSAYPPKLEAGDYADWDDDLAKRFNECFDIDPTRSDHGE